MGLSSSKRKFAMFSSLNGGWLQGITYDIIMYLIYIYYIYIWYV